VSDAAAYLAEVLDQRKVRKTSKKRDAARGDFARSLQERFAAEGVTEMHEAVDGSDEMLAALWGVCRCGLAFRRTTTWTLAGGTITGRTDARCGGGHAVDIPFDRYGPAWVVVTELGRVIYEGAQ